MAALFPNVFILYISLIHKVDYLALATRMKRYSQERRSNYWFAKIINVRTFHIIVS